MTPTRLVLVRHGAPEESSRNRCYGELDVALSDVGRAQAVELAARLPQFVDGKFAAAYSSPRRRAVETARLVAPDVELQLEPALREIDFGAFEGLTYDEAAARDPALYRRWMEQPTEVTFPGGESWPLVKARVDRVSTQIRRRHAGQTVLLVAHGGPLRALLAAALGLPDANIFRIDQSFAGLSIIDWYDELPLVRLVNR